MSCNCSKAKNLTSCITALTIGVATADTDYVVYFKTPTGRIDRYEVTSDEDGNVIVDEGAFRIGDVYEVWITAADADNINERVEFTVGETDLTCLNVQFDVCSGILAAQTITLV